MRRMQTKPMSSSSLTHPWEAGVSRYRITVEDYHRMIEAGILDENDRLELIEGDLTSMPPISPRHAGKTTRLNRLLSQIAGGSALVSVQNPLMLGQHSEPDPDLMLLKPREDFYEHSNPVPADVLLVVEVADTSLDYDRDTKIPLYAAHGIPEVWLVDLQRSRIEIHRDPGPEGYRQILLPDTEQTIAPVSLPDVVIRVSELW